MIFKREGSQFYSYSFWWKGKRVQKCTFQSDKGEAKSLMSVHRTRLARQAGGLASPGDAPLFEDAAKAFLKAGRKKDGRPRDASTQRGYAQCVEVLKPVFSGKRLGEITQADIERFKQEQLAAKTPRGNLKKPGTINRYLACLSRMFALAKLPSPFGKDKVSLLDEKEANRKRRRILTLDEETRYLAKCSPDLRDVAIIALRCGLRSGEIFNLQPGDVYLREGFVQVGDSKSTDGIRSVDMTAEVRQVLQRRVMRCEAAGGKYLFPLHTAKGLDWSQAMTTVKTAHRTALKLSGVKGFRIHDLRHCYGTAQLDAGVDVLTLKANMGHAELSTTMIYAKVSRAKQQQSRDRFETYLLERQMREAERAARGVSTQVQ